MSKGRVAFALGVIVAAFAFVLGFSSTSASAPVLAGTKNVIVSYSPAQPVAGEPFTITFQLRRGGVPIHMAGVGCHAIIGATGHGVPLIDQGTDGNLGHCTWAVPSRASGKTLDGFVAATADNGVTYYHGFDLPIS